MKKLIYTGLIASLFLFLHFNAGSTNNIQDKNEGWEAGVAQVKITPKESMWMAGYAKRTHPSEGKIHDLWVKALAIKDAEGNQAVLVSSDLLGFSKYLSDRIFEKLDLKYGLSRSQVVLNSSHSHSGPVLSGSLVDIYPLDSVNFRKVLNYSRELEDKVVAVIGRAMKSMKPAEIYSGSGISRFQVNRMNNSEKNLLEQTELKGPNDFSVPVLKVLGKNGKLIAVAFSYACHATVLDGYEWCGDYPGFAQLKIEKSHKGTVALFFQGAGGDQNPLPRRSVLLAKQYGGELACSVERVLSDNMKLLAPKLSCVYSEVELQFENYPTEEELVQMVGETEGYEQRWANRILSMLRNNEPIIKSYNFPLQALKIGDQLLLTMGGEPVIGYTIRFKELFGQNIFVFGYSNDLMGYIPTVAVLNHGGYEGKSSQIAYGLPAMWKPDIEERVLKAMTALVAKIETPDIE